MIRAYRPEDLPEIMDIGNRAWREIYQMFRDTYGDELFQLRMPNAETVKGEQIKSHCQAHPEWIYICEEESRVVGFITFRLDQDRRIGEIGNNAVDPECGLRGIGQQMYRAALDYFRAQNMLYATVRTGLDYAHARARRAYERAGFDIRQEDVNYHMKL